LKRHLEDLISSRDANSGEIKDAFRGKIDWLAVHMLPFDVNQHFLQAHLVSDA
jgi:hypothetical protein